MQEYWEKSNDLKRAFNSCCVFEKYLLCIRGVLGLYHVGFGLLVNHGDSTTIVTNRIPFTSQVIEYTEETPIGIHEHSSHNCPKSARCESPPDMNPKSHSVIAQGVEWDNNYMTFGFLEICPLFIIPVHSNNLSTIVGKSNVP